ncbi:MAG: hypothetical protein ACPGNP_09970 [Acidimicrobiales bacterium]
MRLRELVLIGIIILLVGVIAGLGLGDFLGDDETTGVGSDVTTSVDTAASGEDAESGGAAAAPTSTAPTTTATNPTTSSSTTTTTTTTTPPPFAQEVANLPEQTVLGLPLDSLLDEVEYAMVEVFGAPDSDSGWIEGCPFDGPGDLNERTMRWGGLLLNFRSQGGVETLVNWSWRPGSAIPTGSLPVDPQPDSWVITLHDGVDVDMSLAQIGAAVGVPAVVNDFGYPAVQQRGGWTYLALESVDEAPFEIMARFLICD